MTQPTISFENPGTLDPRSITVFGTSSKDSPDSAIGYFGTGLKYAIAILLRTGHSVEIYSGSAHYLFTTEREQLRNDEFDFIYMHEPSSPPQRLAFTTELGKDWSVLDAYRELHSNALDEQGSVHGRAIPHSPSTTLVLVTGPEIQQAYDLRHTIFITSEPFYENDFLSIHPNPTNHLYYKGVAVHKNAHKYAYTYNLKNVELTENRTIKCLWSAHRSLTRRLVQLQNPAVIQQVFASRTSAEAYMDWHWSDSLPSEEFLDFLQPLVRVRSKDIHQSLHALYQSHRPEAEILITYQPKPVEAKMLARAIRFLSDIGHDPTIYPIEIYENLGPDIMGKAQNDTILIARQCFNKGTKYLASTIFEEYTHLTTGYADNTYAMQTHLFDTIISLGEELRGDPL